MKTLKNIASTVLTVLFLYWFGMSAFKLGFYASETPLLNKIVGTLLQKDSESQERIFTKKNWLLRGKPEKNSE